MKGEVSFASHDQFSFDLHREARTPRKGSIKTQDDVEIVEDLPGFGQDDYDPFGGNPKSLMGSVPSSPAGSPAMQPKGSHQEWDSNSGGFVKKNNTDGDASVQQTVGKDDKCSDAGGTKRIVVDAPHGGDRAHKRQRKS